MDNYLFHPWDEKEGNTWMKLDKSEKELVDKLHATEEPIKIATLELLYSDYIYWLGCKKQHPNLAKYRRELEEKIAKEQEEENTDQKTDPDQANSDGNSQAGASTGTERKKEHQEIFRKTSHLLMKCSEVEDLDEIEVFHDPFNRFGLAIFNFMKLQRKLMRFIGYMTIVSVLQMIIFYDGLTEDDIGRINENLGPWQYITSRFSMGSFFQAYPECHTVPLDIDKLDLGCRGTMVLQEIVDVNVFQNNSNLCVGSTDIVNDSLSPLQLKDINSTLQQSEPCGNFKREEFLNKLKQECMGKSNCTIKNYKSDFIKKGGCQDQNLVIQAKCGNKAEVIEKRNWLGLYCTILGVLGNLLFMVGITFNQEKTTKIRSLKMANNTVSSKKYSCELQFDDDHFDRLCYDQEKKEGEKWYQTNKEDTQAALDDPNHWTKAEPNPGHALMDEITRVLELQLTNFYGLNCKSKEEWIDSTGHQRFKQAVKKFDEKQQEEIQNYITDQQFEKKQAYFKVVFCNFAFLNKEMLDALENRASAIRDFRTSSNDFEKEGILEKKQDQARAILETDGSIALNVLKQDPDAVSNDQSQDDGDQPHLSVDSSLTMTPKTAFVTFRNPFASLLAKKMKTIEEVPDEDKPKLFDRDISFSSLGYPSDTLYKNYGVTSFERYVNYFLGLFIFYIGSKIFFSVLYVLYQLVQNKSQFFLETKYCNSLYEQYNKTSGILLQSQFENQVWRKYAEQQLEELDKSQYHMTWQLIAYDVETINKLRGEFQCYCELKNITSLVDKKDKLSQQCIEYKHQADWFQYIGLGASLVITAVNFLLNKLAQLLVTLMSFQTRTKEKTFMYRVSLLFTSVSSIFYLLLLGARLDFVPIIGTQFSQGKNRDFTYDWYFELGSVFIYRMLLLTIQPIQDLILAPVMRYVNQLKFRLKPFSSYSKSMWQYYQIKQKADYQQEFDYSKLGTVLVMAFMFGPGIPIMFPMAFIYILLNQICLRSQLAYLKRAPFKFSNTLNKQFTKFCYGLPILYSGMGLWMYSNRQIFENEVPPKAKIQGFQEHNHTLVYTLTTFTPGTPLLILFVIAVINYLVRICGVKLHLLIGEDLNKLIQKLRVPNLDNFFQNIHKDQQMELFIKFQKYLKRTTGTRTVSDKIYKEFKKEIKQEQESEPQTLLASHLLFDMMIDHNNAMLFEFNYGLIDNVKIKDLGQETDTETRPKESPSVSLNDQEEMKRFIQAEDTKTLFLINYAFLDSKQRKKLLSNIAKANDIYGDKTELDKVLNPPEEQQETSNQQADTAPQ